MIWIGSWWVGFSNCAAQRYTPAGKDQIIMYRIEFALKPDGFVPNRSRKPLVVSR